MRASQLHGLAIIHIHRVKQRWLLQRLFFVLVVNFGNILMQICVIFKFYDITLLNQSFNIFLNLCVGVVKIMVTNEARLFYCVFWIRGHSNSRPFLDVVLKLFHVSWRLRVLKLKLLLKLSNWYPFSIFLNSHWDDLYNAWWIPLDLCNHRLEKLGWLHSWFG